MLIRHNKEVDDWGHLGNPTQIDNVIKQVAKLPNKHRTIDKTALEKAIKGPIFMKKLVIYEGDKFRVPMNQGQLVISRTSPKKYAFEREKKIKVESLGILVQNRSEFLKKSKELTMYVPL